MARLQIEIEKHEFPVGSKLFYKLVHPGNRAYMGWMEEVTRVGEDGQIRISVASLAEKFMVQCMHPLNGAPKYQDIDDLTPKEFGELMTLAPRFLRGELEDQVEVLTDGPGKPVKRVRLDEPGHVAGGKVESKATRKKPGKKS